VDDSSGNRVRNPDRTPGAVGGRKIGKRALRDEKARDVRVRQARVQLEVPRNRGAGEEREAHERKKGEQNGHQEGDADDRFEFKWSTNGRGAHSMRSARIVSEWRGKKGGRDEDGREGGKMGSCEKSAVRGGGKEGRPEMGEGDGR
jgi:hypothetical protein